MDNKNYYCVIMAGGIGSRFWPMSKSNLPKQFLDILGLGKSLLRLTFERFTPIIPTENILVVTNTVYRDLVLEQLPEIRPEQVLLEPMRRNTAPCIAYANHKIGALNPNAKIVVAPSDHLILREDIFREVVLKGLEFVSFKDVLLTLGLKPARPETGYGYIQINGSSEDIKMNNTFRKVKTFTEKPNIEIARVFFESGDFFWNSGLFIWSLESINQAFDSYLPEINNLFQSGSNAYNTKEEEAFIQSVYPGCKNISIDYGIMEKANNVFVLCSEFGWSDLGTWSSLYEHSRKDKAGNVIQGNNIFAYDLHNCIVNLKSPKVAVIQGLDNYIIVESDNVLLVCNRNNEQLIRNYVNDVTLKLGDTFN